jgi:hypothetical protein
MLPLNFGSTTVFYGVLEKGVSTDGSNAWETQLQISSGPTRWAETALNRLKI